MRGPRFQVQNISHGNCPVEDGVGIVLLFALAVLWVVAVRAAEVQSIGGKKAVICGWLTYETVALRRAKDLVQRIQSSPDQLQRWAGESARMRHLTVAR